MLDGRLIHAERSSGGDQSVDDPVKSAFQRRRTKIYQQTNLQIQEAKVSQHLLGMDWRQPLDRLDFNHDQRIDDQVDSEGVIEMEAVVVERNQPLSLNAQTATL